MTNEVIDDRFDEELRMPVNQGIEYAINGQKLRPDEFWGGQLKRLFSNYEEGYTGNKPDVLLKLYELLDNPHVAFDYGVKGFEARGKKCV